VDLRSLLALAMMISCTSLVCSFAIADGLGWKCDGSTNCAPTEPCASPGTDEGGGGVSCTMTTPINHKKCIVAQGDENSCTTVQKDCAKIEVYAGGDCSMGSEPNSCPTGFPGGSYNVQEDGC
jgi:hypothetical protein